MWPPPVTVKEVAAPDPGKTAKVKFPVGKKSTEATVTVSGGAVEGLGVALTEKAQKLKKLKQLQKNLATYCWISFMQVGGEHPEDLTHGLVAGSFAGGCTAAEEAIQAQIDELASPRVTQTFVVPECAVVQIGLRLTKKAGKPAVVRDVKKKLAPRLNLGCEVTAAGLELTLSPRGPGTLRQALGKKLALTVRRSDSALAAEPGATLTFSYTQQT